MIHKAFTALAISWVILFAFANGHFYSFKRDFVVQVHFQNLSNLNQIRGISFVNKHGHHDSVDLLELTNNKTSGSFLINRHIFREATKYFQAKGFGMKVLKNDIDSKIDFERRINRRQYFKSVFQRSFTSKMFYYMRYDEIKEWLIDQAKKTTYMKVEMLSKTAEGRDIILAKISKNEKKPIIWIDGGIHAREWISPSTALFTIYKLLEKTRISMDILNEYQIYILPLLNPDGYEYTHRVNRMWRKNRSPTSKVECVGVDLNRNYPYHWGENGASPDECSRIYQGPSAASEKETQAVIKKLTEIKSNVKLFITLHSFGQYIMTPYGYSRQRFPRQYYKLIEMGASVSNYLLETYGRMYQVGSSANLLYEASGASDDYVAGELRIPFSYTIELPDRGRYGFLLPPTYIKSVGNQFWDSLYKFILELEY